MYPPSAPSPSIVESGQALYVSTEYLEDLTEVLKDRLPAKVMEEVHNYHSLRGRLNEVVHDEKRSNDDKARAVSLLSKGPDSLFASGVQIAGPRHLPRGQTTALYLIIPGGGQRWVVGYYQVYTTQRGDWTYTGYVSKQSRLELFGNQTIEAPRDDLAQITGRSRNGFLGAIEGAFDGYLRYAAQRAGADDMAGPTLDLLGDTYSSLEPEQRPQARQEQLSQRTASSPDRVSFQDRLRSRGQEMAAQSSSSQNSRASQGTRPVGASGSSQYDADGIRKVLEGLGGRTPAWYSEMRSSPSPESRALYDRFLETVAAPAYPQIRQRTDVPEEIWAFLKRLAVSNGFLKDHCKFFNTEITISDTGGCTRMGSCDKCSPEPIKKDRCQRQTVRLQTK